MKCNNVNDERDSRLPIDMSSLREESMFLIYVVRLNKKTRVRGLPSVKNRMLCGNCVGCLAAPPSPPNNLTHLFDVVIIVSVVVAIL